MLTRSWGWRDESGKACWPALGCSGCSVTGTQEQPARHVQAPVVGGSSSVLAREQKAARGCWPASLVARMPLGKPAGCPGSRCCPLGGCSALCLLRGPNQTSP